MATVRLQLRRGTEAQWDAANPTLAAGEIGIETDTNTFKFGDGSTPWNSLSYALSTTVDDYILLSTKGVANGVASLDSSGFIPSAQLPPLAKVTVSAVANQGARLALTAEAGDIAIQSDNGQSYVLSASPASTDANWKALVGSEAVVDTVEASLIAGTGLDKTYDDASGTITIDIDSTVATKTYADQAEADAVTTAASDATTKANAAQAAATSAAASALSTHEADTTAIHGIADTAALATKVYADAAVSTHEADTTSVHGIADTSILVTTTGTQTLAAKSLTSPALTGTPTAPTAAAGTDTTQVATTAFVQDAIELVVGAAPAALNTLAEIATSLADNADLSGTLTTSISGKVAKAGDTMSGELNMGTNKISNLGVPTTGTDASTKAYADGLVVNSLVNHSAISTNIHGITDAANLVYTADVRLSDLRVPQDNSVSTGKIVDLNVTTAKIGDSAITAAKIADGAVGTTEVADLAVTTGKVADSAVTSVKIADSAIVAAKLGIGAVETAALGDLAVTTAKIADSAVTGAKIAANAISQSHLGDDSVGTNEIGGSAVTTAKIADSAVTTSKINNAAVAADKIADSAVTTAKINNAAVTADKIDALAVTEGKIADSAVTTVKIADSAITTGKIANGTIVDADVNASAEIAQSKIASLTTDLAAKLASATAASTYAPLASPTFTGTVSGITKSMVGLGSADDTADTAKPVSTAQATAIATAKAEAIADATSQVNALLTGAPAALNTLDELAAALGDDANFASTVTTSLSAKAPLASPTFTGTVTVAAAGVAFTDGTQTKEGVPSRTVIGTAIGADYNLSTGGLALRDQLIPVSGAHTITVPANSTTAYPVGTSISFYQSAGADAVFAEAAGVTILKTPGLKLRALYSSATITKVATDTWLLAGDLKV